MPPRAYRVDWATGAATAEAVAFTPAEKSTSNVPATVSVPFDDVAATVSKVPSADIAIATVPAIPVQKKVGYVKASRSQPQRPSGPEPKEGITPGKSTSGTGEKPGTNISVGSMCTDVPAEELSDSELESLSDLSGDDELFECHKNCYGLIVRMLLLPSLFLNG